MSSDGFNEYNEPDEAIIQSWVTGKWLGQGKHHHMGGYWGLAPCSLNHRSVLAPHLAHLLTLNRSLAPLRHPLSSDLFPI